MTNRKASKAKGSKWPLCEHERAFSPQRVLMTINPLKPAKGIKEKTLVQIYDKAAPMLVQHGKDRLKWFFGALECLRRAKNPERCGGQFVFGVETLSHKGKLWPDHGHSICEFRKDEEQKRNSGTITCSLFSGIALVGRFS